MRTPTVLLDANVLFSKTLRDWICLTALDNPGMFQPRWTASILTEWQYRLRKEHPLRSEAWVTKYRKEMEGAFPEGVITDFAVTHPDWLADIDDAHVHSAAVVAGVEYLVTDDHGWDNAPADELPYEVHTSDSFLCLCVESQEQVLANRVAAQLAYTWTRRSSDEVDIVGPLKRAGAVHFAEEVRRLSCQPRVQELFDQLLQTPRG